jgi:2-amino-4-hydroxy-6-hydroxymethyldihydropteridine diphosphokinase
MRDRVRTVRAHVGLGANVGDAPEVLARAIRILASLPRVRLRAVSRLYVTAPVGVTDQPDFHNAAVALDVAAGTTPTKGALDLLDRLKGIERDLGRQRRRRWGPREVDLDLLVFGRAEIRVERTEAARSIDPAHAARLLEVPHPEARRRLFVLAPLADLAPGLVPPGWGMSVETARREREAAEGPDAVRPTAVWDRGAGGWTGREATRP